MSLADFPCTGLRAENPIGAMAAFGLLRLCAARGWFGKAKLSWRPQDGFWRAVLHTERRFNMEALAEELQKSAGEISGRGEVTQWQEIKSLSVEEFSSAARQALNEGEQESVSWLSAFASDLSDSGKLACTPFDMTVARQRLLADFVRLSALLATKPSGRKKRTPEERFGEAIEGPWMYSDDQHSLGWDPVAMRLGAFTTNLPSKMSNAGVAAAVWLAFNSLPLFPCFRSGKVLATRSWTRDKEGSVFIWPVWTEPLGLPALERLLCLPELAKSRGPNAGHNMRALQCRGVVAVYWSRRVKPNKYMTTLEPAVPVAGSVPASQAVVG